MAVSLFMSASARERTIDDLERGTFDCVVIGGGITGAGITREATRRGMRVALLEAEDFAAGTSSRSSKLIHGGLRYLAMGDVSLVRETALERGQVHRLAPHLAERRWVIVPARSRAGLLKVKVGVSLYEKLGAVAAEDLHSNWGVGDLEANEPCLNTTHTPWACTYREYLTDDARLVLANLRSAAFHGAVVLNYAPVDAIVSDSGRANGIEAECRLSGRRFRVNASVVVNAAGPWAEAVRLLEDPDAKSLLVLSKGIHVVVSHDRFPLRHMVVIGAGGGRSIFVIPRGPIVFIGTTDTLHPDGATLWPEIRREDVEYLLGPIQRYFQIEPLGLEDVIAAWAGLRPLIAQPGKRTTDVSRRDEILVGPAGVVSVAGGKLTGYRPMARRVLEEIEKRLGRSFATDGEEEPLPGGDFSGDLDQLSISIGTRFGVGSRAAYRCAHLYGSESSLLIERGAEPLFPGSSILSGEVEWAVQEEGAVHIEDWLYRRSRAALYDPEERARAVEPASRRMANLLGWSAQRTTQEVTSVNRLLENEFRFKRTAS